ncbi:MAG: hypothetical protein IPF51_12180 [Dehalococcoidia bacterium]|uniref:hypothetical protein n=1 Tax=Candidatus Amarobacter glycogenicus TaxID=3140699 RepID=UPI00313660FD|nr:hypothetical protein [Dehalococcoidia bacterium]
MEKRGRSVVHVSPHERFAEAHLTGVLEAPERLLPEELAEVIRLGAILYDSQMSNASRLTPGQWAMRRLAERGVRIAACAPRAEWFGVGRQAAQMGNLEGPNFRLFRTRGEAVAWLIHPEWSAAK